MHRILVSVWLAAAVAAALAQVPAAELAKPPADARHFVIQSTGGKHGDSWSWVAADGTRMGRESMNLRGQVFELDSSGKAGRRRHAVGDRDPRRDAAGRRGRDLHDQRRHGDAGRARSTPAARSYSAPAFYVSQGGPIDTTAWFLEALLAQARQVARPAARRQGARRQADRLSTSAPARRRQTITLWAVTGISTSPLPIWADANNKFFGLTFGIAWLPEAYAGEQAKIEEAQAKAMAAQAPGLAKSLVKVPAGPVAFTGVRLFDADATRFLADQTVVVDKGVIAAVGAARVGRRCRPARR